MFFFFFQAEDGIRDKLVTGVQTCALPISHRGHRDASMVSIIGSPRTAGARSQARLASRPRLALRPRDEIGRAAGRERGEISGGAGSLKKKKKKKEEERVKE